MVNSYFGERETLSSEISGPFYWMTHMQLAIPLKELVSDCMVRRYSSDRMKARTFLINSTIDFSFHTPSYYNNHKLSEAVYTNSPAIQVFSLIGQYVFHYKYLVYSAMYLNDP